MASKKQRQNNIETVGVVDQLAEYLVLFAAILMCVLLPLIMKDGYSQISDVKYAAYKWICILGFDVAAVLGAIGFLIRSNKDVVKVFKEDKMLYFFIGAFIIANILGTAFSVDKNLCINGVVGWNMGLLSQLSFMLILLLFKNYAKHGRVVLTSLVAVAFIVYIFGIINRFGIDPLNVYRIGTSEEMPNHYKLMFLSTVGQATWYSSFVSVTLPVIAGFYLKTEDKKYSIISGIFLFAGFMTLVSQNSDSMYMAFAAFMLVLFCYACSDGHYIERLLREIVLFFIASRVVKIGYLITGYNDLRFDKISAFLINNNFMWVLAILSVAIWQFYYQCIFKKNKFAPQVFKGIRKIVLVITGAFIIFAIGILILDAQGVLPQNITNITHKIPYLKWSEFWGSGRGKTWTFSMKMFNDMNIVHKLVGFGPDGYMAYAYTYYNEELRILWPQDTMANAHNEFINGLLSYGVVGIISYVGIFIYTIKKMLEKTENIYSLLVVSAVIAYMSHNFFCYQQVCCTPFIFMIMGIGLYNIKK